MSRRTPWSALTAVFASTALVAVVMVAPATAESACMADAAGDVRDQATRDVIDDPRGDLLAVCIDYDQTRLRVTARVASPTDPATDPAWAGMQATVGMVIDTDGDTSPREGAPGGEEFLINLARFPDANGGDLPPEIRTYLSGSANTLATNNGAPCISPAVFDGVTYRITVPAACLGNPRQIQSAVYMYLASNVEGSEDVGVYDEIPMAPAYLRPITTNVDSDTAVDRLSGPSRVETALAVSQDDFSEGAAGAVVLARADAAPDALSAAPLAVAVNGPLLLTGRDDLPSSVEAEIQRVLPDGGRVLLSGGQAAISSTVADQLAGLGYAVERVSGPTRYATSVEVARATNPDPSLIVVANGNDFPDALVGGALAGAEGGVQVLSNGTSLDDTAAAYLRANADAEVVAIGSVAAQAVPDATAVVGADVFATSVAAAARYSDVSGVAIASGTNFPDGLAGGAHAGRAGIPLLLSWPDLLPDSVSSYLSSLTPLQRVAVYGGTAAISHQIERDAEAALG